MFGLGVFALLVGYAMVYTGVSNLWNGGQGPSLFESLGIKNKLASPADLRKTGVAQGSSNQSFNAPSSLSNGLTIEPL